MHSRKLLVQALVSLQGSGQLLAAGDSAGGEIVIKPQVVREHHERHLFGAFPQQVLPQLESRFVNKGVAYNVPIKTHGYRPVGQPHLVPVCKSGGRFSFGAAGLPSPAPIEPDGGDRVVQRCEGIHPGHSLDHPELLVAVAQVGSCARMRSEHIRLTNGGEELGRPLTGLFLGGQQLVVHPQ